MNKLPVEILNTIFICMDLSDRMECSLVCRNWYHVLQEYSLFKDVDIQDRIQLERFLQIMEQSPHYGAQVQELCVKTFINPYVNKRTYANIFPNARVLKVVPHHSSLQIPADYPHSEQIQTNHPTSKVKILHDSGYCELASQMLVANRCEGLKELKLDFDGSYTADTLDVIGQINNLPALNTLALKKCMIGAYDLENIHENAPNIRELELYQIYIIGGEIPSIISPAHSVISIHISIIQAYLNKRNDQNLGPFELHNRFYQYMSRKYLNLINVDHLNSELHGTEPDRRRRQVILYYLRDFYKSILGPRTIKLHVQTINFDINIFDICDDNNCQIEEFKVDCCDKERVLQHLAHSNQRNHILKLNLRDAVIDSPSDLTYLKELQVLQLSFPWPFISPVIHFTDYLNSCPPPLKYFSINCPHLDADPRNTRSNEIETLVISCRDPGPNICKVISSSFPHLVELNFTGTICIQSGIILELHSPTLKRATFNYSRVPSVGYVFAYKSLQDTQFEYYHIKDKRTANAIGGEIRGVFTLSVTTLENKRVIISSNVITLVSM